MCWASPGGGAAGYFLRPTPQDVAGDCVCEQAIGAGDADTAPDDPVEAYEYVDIQKQFLVPIIEDESMTGMMIMSLSLEVSPGTQEAVFSREPKLRDEFLRILFAYASIGAFAENFMDANDLKLVRSDLTEAAKDVLGPIINEVLIVDMIRQDM